MSNSMDKLAKGIRNAIEEKNDRKPSPYDAQATVLSREGDILWVHIPGGVDRTPVRRTVDAEEGDQIMVRVADGRAWVVGNYTNPPTDGRVAIAASKQAAAAAGQVNSLNEFVMENSRIVNADIENVKIKNVAMENVMAQNARITNSFIDGLTAEGSEIRNSKIEGFTVINGVVQGLQADRADIFGRLTASEAVINSLDTNYAHISNGVIDNAEIGYADVQDLDAHYAQIDIANVNNAWIENGTIKKAEVFDENVFDLSGDHATIRKIDASKINVSNLKADNLIVRRINGQPVVGGYTLIDSNSSGYASKNPQALGWYEFVNAQWVLSTDTTVDMTKAYYQTGDEVSLYDQQYINNLKNELNQRIDGAVESFTGTVVPTLTNYPYNTWYDTSVTPIHDERANHVGDIYYVVNAASDQDGYAYRFAFDNTTNAYDWVLIRDTDITKALSDISDLQTFESETTSWMDETDEGLETIRTNHTTLSGVVDKTVKESVQLWFTKANTTAPNKPTAEVTSTSTAGNAWRKVVPAYNASYPNYYYCWQYKFVDDTFGWSAVVRDIAMGETQGTARDAQTTANSNIKSSVQLWFTKANTTAPSKPTAQVTNSNATGTDSYNKWNLVVPIYNSSYPYYYYCYQQQKGDGTYQWSDVIYDQATSDSMKTAKEALPASTFTSFESTTFKDVKDTVTEHSTKFTNMTSRLGLNSDGTGANTDIVAKESALETTVDGISTRVGKTETKLIGMYATSSTAAGTAAKVATITPALPSGATWELGTGTIITVKFTNANTTSSPTLNVNSKGAKTIKTYANGNLSEAEYKWAAGSTFTFVYNGTNWLMQDSTASVRMNSAETSITENAEQIALRAKSSDVYTKEQVYTKTEADSAIIQKSNEISLSVAQTEITKIEVGGRNLILNSATERISPASASGSAYVSPGCMLTEYGINTLTNTDDNFVYSFDYEVTGNSSSEGYIYTQAKGTMISGSSIMVLDAPTGHYTHVFKLNSTQASSTNYSMGIRLRSATDGAVLRVWNIKLEKGNKATDWSPAPEDVDAQIDGIEIGGRNLLRRTKTYEDWQKVSSITLTQDEEGITVANWSQVDTASWRDIRSKGDEELLIPYSLVRDREVTLSCWFKMDTVPASDINGILYAVFSLNNAGDYTGDRKKHTTNVFYGKIERTTDWQRVVWTGTISDALFVNGTGTIADTDLFYIQIYNHNLQATHVKKVKLEYGNKATDWTPAPEDTESKIIELNTSITETADAIKLEASRRESAVNMLLDADAPSLTKVYAANDRYWSDSSVTAVIPSIVEISDPPVQGIAHAARFVCDGTNTSYTQRAHTFYSTNDNIIPLIAGQTYTATWWARCTNGSGLTKCNISGKGGTDVFNSPVYDLTSEWKMFSFTVTVVEPNTNANKIWFYARFPNNTAGTVEICGCKLVAGDAVEAYKTTIEQTANNVLIKATIDGASIDDQKAGGTSAAALINVAPDTVKIAANHVEIDGTATFNAIKSSADAAYDSKGSASAVQTNLDNLDIGGRNLVLGTSDQWVTTSVVEGTKRTVVLANFDKFFIATIPDVQVNDAIQISFDIKFGSNWGATGTGTKRSFIQGTSNKSPWTGISMTGGTKQERLEEIMASSSREGHVNTYFKVTSTMIDGSGDQRPIITIRFDYYSGDVSIKCVKFEKASKPSNWTPAPEDVQAEIDGKTASWVLKSGNVSGASYSTILGYAAEGTQTTFTIDSSTPTTGIKAGDTVRLAYLANNMGTGGTTVYIVGTAKTTPTSATSITLIGHGLDTTVIDGGHILTGTIDANRIGANSITIGKINSSDSDTANALLNSVVHEELTSTRTWYATCDTAAATVAKVATITPTTTEFTSSIMTPGTTVFVKFTNTNSGAVGSLTLSVNGTTAKNIKYINNTAISNIPDKGYIVGGQTYQFVYDGTYWVIQNLNYNTNTWDRTKYTVSLTATAAITGVAPSDNPATTGIIGVVNTSGKIVLLGGTAFDITKPIVYIGTAYTSSALTQSNNYIHWGTAFTITNTHAVTGAGTGKPVYIVGTLSGTTFTPDSTVLTCTPPSSANGKVYLRLGLMTSSTAAVLDSDHPMYMYFDGKFQQCDPATASAACTATNYIYADSSGIRIASASPSTQKQRMELTSSALKMYDSGDIQRILLDNSNGVIVGRPTKGNVKVTDTSIGIYDTNNVERTQINTSGLLIKDASGNWKASFYGDINLYAGGGTYPLTSITSSEVKIAQSANNYAKVDSNGLQVYQGGSSAASFGASATIGRTTQNHIVINDTNTEFYSVSTLLGVISSSAGSLHILGSNGLDLFTGSGKKINMEATGSGAEFNLTSTAIKLFGPVTTNSNVTVGGGLVVNYHAITNLYGYNDTVSYATNMYIGNTGILHRTTTTSSRRYKHDIRDVVNKELDPHNLYDIEVKQFKYNDDVLSNKDDQRYQKDLIGFISEQVKECYPIAVDINENGECESWHSQYIIPPMLALIQDLHREIEELKAERS